jgi:hypothetical protein
MLGDGTTKIGLLLECPTWTTTYRTEERLANEEEGPEPSVPSMKEKPKSSEGWLNGKNPS